MQADRLTVQSAWQQQRIAAAVKTGFAHTSAFMREEQGSHFSGAVPTSNKCGGHPQKDRNMELEPT